MSFCACGGSDNGLGEQKRLNEIIDTQLKRERAVYRATHRLLLQGTSKSGKSTVAKQMRILYGDGYPDGKRLEMVPYIKCNVKDVIMTVIDAMSQIIPPCTFALAESVQRLQYIKDTAAQASNFDYPAEFFEAVDALWEDPGVKECYRRSSEYQLIDCAPYFMSTTKLKQIALPGYKPSDDDILHCRVHNSGNIQTNFIVDRVYFKMFDIRGQMGEKRKWMQCFSDVTAIIFVTDCSSFNVITQEDRQRNRLRESMELFESIWNNRWLHRISIILLLNKQDILREKVDQGCKVEDYFPEFISYSPPQELHAAESRDPNDSYAFMKAKFFFRDQFLRISHKSHDDRHHCLPHFVTAIDMEKSLGLKIFHSWIDITTRMHYQKYELL